MGIFYFPVQKIAVGRLLIRCGIQRSGHRSGFEFGYAFDSFNDLNRLHAFYCLASLVNEILAEEMRKTS